MSDQNADWDELLESNAALRAERDAAFAAGFAAAREAAALYAESQLCMKSARVIRALTPPAPAAGAEKP